MIRDMELEYNPKPPKYMNNPFNVGNHLGFHYKDAPVLQDYFFWTVNWHIKVLSFGDRKPLHIRIKDFLIDRHWKIMERFWQA